MSAGDFPEQRGVAAQASEASDSDDGVVMNPTGASMEAAHMRRMPASPGSLNSVRTNPLVCGVPLPACSVPAASGCVLHAAC